MTDILKKAYNAVKCTYMCIRYPFLYPRNRFTGRHYNNWRLIGYHRKNYGKAVIPFIVNVVHTKELKDDEKKIRPTVILGNSKTLTFESDKYDKYLIHIYINDSERMAINVKAYCPSVITFTPIGFYYNENSVNFYIWVPDGTNIENTSACRFLTLKVDRWLYFKIRTADFLNDYVLQLFHCIPTYTEWFAMESYTGWYKAFGKQLLKDIDRQLRKDKMRRSWRIMDIKEKYGSLQIYCYCATAEMYNLLAKYEDISYHTCIICGKPAKYLTGGYILPYCDEHFKENGCVPYAEIGEDGQWKYTEDEYEEI